MTKAEDMKPDHVPPSPRPGEEDNPMNASRVPSDGDTARLILEVLAPQLGASAHPAQRRQGHDLARFAAMEAGPWRGRFALRDCRPGKRGSFALALRLQSDGFIWNGEPRRSDVFDLVVEVDPTYPLAAPRVIFTGPSIPFHGNVFDADADVAPSPRGMPPEIQQMVRQGARGICCYALASQWRARLDCNLITVVRQVSRLLVGAKMHGEAYALNPRARDHYLDLLGEGRLPLGPALALPCAERPARPTEAIRWRDPKPQPPEL